MGGLFRVHIINSTTLFVFLYRYFNMFIIFMVFVELFNDISPFSKPKRPQPLSPQAPASPWATPRGASADGRTGGANRAGGGELSITFAFWGGFQENTDLIRRNWTWPGDSKIFPRFWSNTHVVKKVEKAQLEEFFPPTFLDSEKVASAQVVGLTLSPPGRSAAAKMGFPP